MYRAMAIAGAIMLDKSGRETGRDDSNLYQTNSTGLDIAVVNIRECFNGVRAAKENRAI